MKLALFSESRTLFRVDSILCCLIVCACFGALLLDAQEPATEPKEASSAADARAEDPADDENRKAQDANLELLTEAIAKIKENYVTEVDDRELVEAAIDGMLASLDQHSDYVSPKELSRFRSSIESEFAGIGIHVSIEDGFLHVISPVHGSPAYKGGVLSGDKILKIDDRDAEGITMDEAIQAIKGKIGTTVRVTVQHLAGDEATTGDEATGDEATKDNVEELVLARARIRVPTVLGDRIDEHDKWVYWIESDADDGGKKDGGKAADEKIGYVRLTSFSRRTVIELVPVLERMKSAGVRGLILDLRYNPGGLLPAAIQICDLFVEDGRIVSTRGRKTKERAWEARRDDLFPEIPMAVLVNGYSASASEIVAACLKDNDRAVIVGQRTFGKGSVQNVIEIEDGRSVLKLTTAGYFRPNGENIHRLRDAKETDQWGVHPSDGFKVEFDDEQSVAYLKYRRNRDALKNETVNAQDANEKVTSFDDLQLNKAIEYIRGKLQ